MPLGGGQNRLCESETRDSLLPWHPVSAPESTPEGALLHHWCINSLTNSSPKRTAFYPFGSR